MRPVTVGEWLREAERRLREAGVTSPALDAEMLLRHVLGWERARVLTSSPERIETVQVGRLEQLVAQRAARTPLQHLTGTQAFWRREFKVTPDVLIPRPETEILVEAALDRLRGVASPVVVDVGAGSGCIAVSIAAERPDARVVGIDVSEASLAVAASNAAGVPNVSWRKGDLLQPAEDLRGAIDLIASNPPYIDPAERETLAPEVRDHEPALALFAPQERYSVYRRLIPAASDLLRSGGWLLLEVGAGMADEVARLCRASGLDVERVLSDLQSIPRTVVARRA
jgi:release factor glutamine methyltransferase